jgi:hypothetical protein
MNNVKNYNERLFSGNWRSALHLSRFYWLVKQIQKLNIQRAKIIELGCYDAKTIDFLVKVPLEIQEYLGFDRNWEGGLDIGLHKWKNYPNIHLHYCEKPEDISNIHEVCNIGICMETLEHINPEMVEPYLFKLSQVIKGYIFITVPVERGLPFLLKHGTKNIFSMKDDAFEKGEFFNSIIGRMDKVERCEHKGFDDRVLLKQVKKYFNIIDVKGIFPGMPLVSLNFTIGIIAKTKGWQSP